MLWHHSTGGQGIVGRITAVGWSVAHLAVPLLCDARGSATKPVEDVTVVKSWTVNEDGAWAAGGVHAHLPLSRFEIRPAAGVYAEADMQSSDKLLCRGE